ncbi:flagellin [Lysinibacillus sp. RC79]|uniref:flagellin N-terminal helical domain-containing protein n=1 Tax=Lysinibacillus sp. RC79 TaxID=3156296 RepID=UPI003519B20E
MIVKHNIPSLNINNRLTQNKKKADSVLEKLSSGYKINRAGDDAAGLAISEKMRGQIRGLNMAGKNVQDGISLIQTAESGLGSIQDPTLLRLRELAIQAANDTLTDGDRTLIQYEVKEIKNGINEIANNTEFNNIKLLNNKMDNYQISKEAGYEWEIIDTGSTSSITSVNKISDKYIGVGQYGTILSSTDGITWDINTIDPSFDFLEVISNGNQLVAIGNRGNIYLTDDGINWTKQTVSNDDLGIIKHAQLLGGIWDGEKYLVGTDMGLILSSKDGLNWITSPLPGATGNDIAYNGNIYVSVGNSGSIATSNDGINWTSQKSLPTQNLTHVEWINGRFISVGEYGAIVSSIDGINWVKESPLDSIRFDTIASNGNTILIGGIGNENFLISNDGIKWESLGIDKNLTIKDVKYNKEDNEYIASTYQGHFLRSKAILNSNKEPKKINLQIGANSNQSIKIELSDVRTTALGLDNINLSTQKGANDAISIIDKAIAIVSKERSKYGAYQNRLEHANQSVMNTSENLQSAESRIRDTDIAKGMMILTKNNILLQATQSMLAQSNKQPEGILQLLQ